jgi:hypothetical protein
MVEGEQLEIKEVELHQVMIDGMLSTQLELPAQPCPAHPSA